MKQITPQDGQSADIISENIEKLKQLFPDAFTENGINFEVLRQLLGDASVLDEGEEKYGLNWHGKKKARQIALTPSTGTLLPCPEESVDWDATQNLFIEGDNLEVLKLLQRPYANKVKMIYIDPPYNTGKEFVYPDNFQDNLDTYLKYTGQKDNEGMKFSSNTETGGRKHTNWLNMLAPRLKLARNILAHDGVIFISIDDNEQGNLRLLCDEIFGSENFVNNIIWQKKYSPSNDAKWLSDNHDFILCYAKNKESWRPKLLPRDKKALARYKNPDNDPRGLWKSGDLSVKSYSENCDFQITTPSGRVVSPPKGGCWRVTRKRFDEMVEDNRIWFGDSGNNVPAVKRFLSEVKDGVTPLTLWTYKEVGHNQTAKTELKKLFEDTDGRVFDTPKPVSLMRRLLEIGSERDSIILDFFAGSGSLAHAVFEQNAIDNGQRSFINVQLPEKTGDETTNLAEMCAERIRRAGKTVLSEYNTEIDIGFKYFKLCSSNIRAWNPDRTDLEETLLTHKEHLVEGRSEQDILYELLLKRGIELTVPIEETKAAGKTIYSIGYGVLFACLDTSIKADEVDILAQAILDWHKQLEPETDTHVFFRDSAFDNDIAKTNMAAILEQNGITHVRSL